MPEYIEREALLKEFNECFPSLSFLSERDISLIAVKARIETIPAAGVVEVVRCKDCKVCLKYYPEKRIGEEPQLVHYCNFFKSDRRPTDYCSFGERKEGAEE